MLNQVVLVGRIVTDIEPTNSDNENEFTFKLSITNKDEEKISSDIIPIIIKFADIRNHCGKHDLIGIKGKIEMIDNKVNIIAQKATFLSTK